MILHEFVYAAETNAQRRRDSRFAITGLLVIARLRILHQLRAKLRCPFEDRDTLAVSARLVTEVS